ncbi:MAG: hypothetical protein ABI548_28870 [Polyangiaceae bacterium]
MPLDPKQRWALDCFYPGLVVSTEQLGVESFEAKTLVIHPRGEGIGLIQMELKCALKDKMQLAVVMQLKRKPGLPGFDPQLTSTDLTEWLYPYYSLDYSRRLSDATFRFDLDRNGPAHVHIKPNVKDHWPADQTTPDTRGMDPRAFVAMVAKFRRDKIYPVTRVIPKRKKP